MFTPTKNHAVLPYLASAAGESDPRVFSIDGRYLGTEVPADFRGVYIQHGRKHLKMQ